MQTVVTLVVIVVAVLLLIRYFWLEFRNPCKGCTKECDKRKR